MWIGMKMKNEDEAKTEGADADEDADEDEDAHVNALQMLMLMLLNILFGVVGGLFAGQRFQQGERTAWDMLFTLLPFLERPTARLNIN